MTKSRDLGDLAQTVAVNLPTSLGTAGQSLVVNSGADGLEFGAASGGGVTVYTGLSGTDGTPSGATYLLNASSPSAGDLAYVSSNTSLYQNNGNGWYRIAVINTTPTISSVADASSNTTPFTLEGGTNTVITVTASDVDEGTDLTYSHSVTSGSLNGTTVTQGTGASENVFTIAPHASNATTFSITFSVSDSINAATSVAAFALEFQITDSHFTSLLMATDGSAGDNSTITYDTGSSTGNSLTEYGDVHAGTFSPYRHGGYSTYMVNTDDLTVASDADFNFGSGDFTIEYWIWPNGTPNNPVGLPDMRPVSTDGKYIQININTSNQVGLYVDSAQRIAQSASTALTSNAWNHVCLARSGSTTTLYIGGASVGSWSDSTTYLQGRCLIVGHSYNADRGWASGCYISDFRIVKGTAITPASGGPTERLTAVTNTKLLTCHLPYIADTPPSGGTAKTLTVNGDPETKTFGPYDYNEYASGTNGGSVYFDGSDYLQLSATATDLLPETSNTTIEAWVNTTGTGHVSVFSNFNPSSPYNGMEVGLYNGYQTIYSQGSWINNTGGTGVSTINDGLWHHLAWVITNSGATVTTYVDGVQNYTSSITASTTGSSNQRIGASSNSTVNRHFTGYISDVRFVKGTAVYSGAFTPPTGPLTTTGGTYSDTTNVDTSITASNTKLLLKGTDAHVLDKSQVSNLKLAGTAAAVTDATNNSNTSSTNAVSFDGDSDYVFVPASSLLDISSSDITIEGYFYTTSTSVKQGVWEFYSDDNNYARLFFEGGNGNVLRLTLYSSATQRLNATGTTTLSINTWYHIAVTRDHSSGAWKTFIDGVQDTGASGTESAAVDTSSWNFEIGRDLVATDRYWSGYMQDFRFTQGKNRYPNNNFTVPSAPLKG